MTEKKKIQTHTDSVLHDCANTIAKLQKNQRTLTKLCEMTQIIRKSRISEAKSPKTTSPLLMKYFSCRPFILTRRQNDTRKNSTP